jgi:hypothetical protein
MFMIAEMYRGAYRIVLGPFPSIEVAQSVIIHNKLPCPHFQVIDLTIQKQAAA